MLPAFALIAFIAVAASPMVEFNVPSETLIPVPSGTLYVGDNIDCTDARVTMLRYGADKSLSICHAGKWEALVIQRKGGE